MQTHFSIVKFLFTDLLYRSKFPKGGISEQLSQGYKDLEDINADSVRKYQLQTYSSLLFFLSFPFFPTLSHNHSQFQRSPFSLFFVFSSGIA